MNDIKQRVATAAGEMFPEKRVVLHGLNVVAVAINAFAEGAKWMSVQPDAAIGFAAWIRKVFA